MEDYEDYFIGLSETYITSAKKMESRRDIHSSMVQIF